MSASRAAFATAGARVCGLTLRAPEERARHTGTGVLRNREVVEQRLQPALTGRRRRRLAVGTPRIPAGPWLSPAASYR